MMAGGEKKRKKVNKNIVINIIRKIEGVKGGEGEGGKEGE